MCLGLCPPQYGCVSTSPDLRLKTVCSRAAGSRPRTSPDEPCEQSAPSMNTADARSPKHAHSPRDRSSILTRWSMGKWCLKSGVWDLLGFFRPVLLIQMKSAGVWWCACAWPLTIDPCLSVCVELSRLLGRRADRKAPVSANWMQHLHIRTNGYPVNDYLNTKGWVECNIQNSSDCDILRFISDYFLQIKTPWDNEYTWRNLAVHDLPCVWGVHDNRMKVCPWLPWARGAECETATVPTAWNTHAHAHTNTHVWWEETGVNVSQRLCSLWGFCFSCKIHSRDTRRSATRAYSRQSRQKCHRSCFCPNK